MLAQNLETIKADKEENNKLLSEFNFQRFLYALHIISAYRCTAPLMEAIGFSQHFVHHYCI